MLKTTPLRGVIRGSFLAYWRVLSRMLRASFWPLLFIFLLRWLSDDKTGDQYSLVISLISVFVTMLLARIAVHGWEPKEIRTIALYNAVLSRYLSGFGLLASYIVLGLPVLSAFLLGGLIVLGQIPLWVLAIAVPLGLLGLPLLIGSSFAMFALMDDMELSVWQSLRVSNRLTWKFKWPLIRALAVIGLGLVIFLGLIVWVGGLIAPDLQSPAQQLILDTLTGWLITPYIFELWGTVYQRLVENYE